MPGRDRAGSPLLCRPSSGLWTLDFGFWTSGAELRTLDLGLNDSPTYMAKQTSAGHSERHPQGEIVVQLNRHALIDFSSAVIPVVHLLRLVPPEPKPRLVCQHLQRPFVRRHPLPPREVIRVGDRVCTPRHGPIRVPKAPKGQQADRCKDYRQRDPPSPSPAQEPWSDFSFQIFSFSNLVSQVCQPHRRPKPRPAAVALQHTEAHHPRRHQHKPNLELEL